MSALNHPRLSLQELSKALGTLRHLQEIIEGVRLDFFGETHEVLPQEVTQLHLCRETLALNRQLEQALTFAFGNNSRQLGRLREIGIAPASSRSLMNAQVLIDSGIAELEHMRVELLRSRTNGPIPAPVIQDALHG